MKQFFKAVGIIAIALTGVDLLLNGKKSIIGQIVYGKKTKVEPETDQIEGTKTN